MTDAPLSRPTPSAEAWLDTAYDVLTDSGVDAVKVMPLAKRLGVARTGFYWHFKDRDELLEAMVRRWEERNTGNLVTRTEAYAEGIAEALFNLFDCWLDPELFDGRLDLAIRNWARTDAGLQNRLDLADERREQAIADMFVRHGFSPDDARIRARTVIYTQIGYLSMQVCEQDDRRIAQMPTYIHIFSGVHPTQRDIDRFMTRHAWRLPDPQQWPKAKVG